MTSRKKRTDLVGAKLRWTGAEPDFSVGDNKRAWDAIFPFLSDPKYRASGLDYELLTKKAKNAASSVGSRYINYCEELGYLQIAQDDKRALLRPGESAHLAHARKSD